MDEYNKVAKKKQFLIQVENRVQAIKDIELNPISEFKQMR